MKVLISFASMLLALLIFLAGSLPVSMDAHAETEFRRDPFQRGEPAASSRSLTTSVAADGPEPLELRAVIYDREHSLANINGNILAVGESWRGYRLLKLDERSAVLSANGRQIVLSLDRKSQQ